MKTPAEIANEIVNSLNKDGTIAFAGLDRSPDKNELTRAIVHRAIETDRADRDFYEMIAEALDDRSDWEDGDGENAQRAAELIREGTEDYIWDRYIGPMIDDLMRNLGGGE